MKKINPPHLCPGCLGAAELTWFHNFARVYQCPRCYDNDGEARTGTVATLRGVGCNGLAAQVAWDYEVEAYLDGAGEVPPWVGQYCDAPERDPMGADAIELPAGWV